MAVTRTRGQAAASKARVAQAEKWYQTSGSRLPGLDLHPGRSWRIPLPRTSRCASQRLTSVCTHAMPYPLVAWDCSKVFAFAGHSRRDNSRATDGTGRFFSRSSKTPSSSDTEIRVAKRTRTREGWPWAALQDCRQLRRSLFDPATGQHFVK